MNTETDNSPGLRLMELLDLLTRHAQPMALPEVVALTGWPKPTVHRMLAQLEQGGWLVREPDGRRYAIAARLLRMAEAALSNSTQQGVRHAVLRQLVAEVGESCNLTALSGAEVVYLDRVESAFPLRLELRRARACRRIVRPAASCSWPGWARASAAPCSTGWCSRATPPTR